MLPSMRYLEYFFLLKIYNDIMLRLVLLLLLNSFAYLWGWDCKWMDFVYWWSSIREGLLATMIRPSKTVLCCAVKKSLLTILRKKMRKKYPKSHIKDVKRGKKTVKMFKIHDFSSLGLHIPRFCENSAKLCAVARPHDRDI